MAPAVVDEAARTLSFSGGAPAPLRVYFDVSGSMRGFALAAQANALGAGDAFSSFLNAITDLSRDLPETQAPSDPGRETNDGGRAATRRHPVMLFGSTLIEQQSFDAVANAAMGRVESTSTSGALPPSADCPGAPKWNGPTVLRRRIDTFFSHPTTCLDQVFLDVMTNGRGRVNVIVTDAEQTAPLNDRGCPNPANVGNIQSYINTWTRQGGFAAVLAATMPYQPWRSEGITSHCACTENLVFAYVLAPSFADAERVSNYVRAAWKGSIGAPVYLPLVPRPAGAYTVRVITGDDKTRPIIFAANGTKNQREPPEVGRLPQVWLELKGDDDDDALVAFDLDRAGFENTVVGSETSIDWSKSTLQWNDPIPLDANGRPDPNAASALSLVRVTPPLANEAQPVDANVRTLRFLGQNREPGNEVKPRVEPLRLRIRRTASGDGCQWYLIEAVAPARTHASDVVGTMAKLSSNMCLNWDAVRAQVDSVFQTGPSVRFLLHVDYY